MPLYEYECESCGLHFEKSQRFSEEPVRFCPNCGGPVHRVIQPVGVI
ncbi:MAG: zinc ribbon domain-containing protein, partial [Anaerolineae bacterium]